MQSPSPEFPDIPIILVHDHTHSPVLTTLYVNGANTLDFRAIYTSVKTLLRHPPCTHRPSATHWPCPPCSESFTTTFWTTACRLLDYFADFVALDTGLMTSLWFHLLDLWQGTHTWFPCAAILSPSPSPSPSPRFVADTPARKLARAFSSDFNSTLKLIDTVLHGHAQAHGPREKIIHAPCGDVASRVGAYNTGPWLSGLKPWEQFLLRSSPGVAPSYSGDENKNKNKNKNEIEIEIETLSSVRYVPMPAISIVQTHTERARHLAENMSMSRPPSFLNAFEHFCLRFPMSESQHSAHGYMSRGGQRVRYRLVNGGPPIMRYEGYGNVRQGWAGEGLAVLNDFVARVRGVEAYEAVCEDEGAGAFDMWAVVVSEEEVEERFGEST